MDPANDFTRTVRRPLGALLVFTLAVASLRAQEVGWASVRRLSPGTEVVITTTSGAQLEGDVGASGEDQITIIAKRSGERRIAPSDVRSIVASRRDSVWTGVFAGAALGFGGGAGLGAAWFYGSGRYGAKPPGYASEFISATGVIGGALGALVGWRMDKARIQREVVYDAAAVP